MRPVVEDPDRIDLVALAPVAASIAAFTVAAITVSFQSRVADEFVAVALGLLVVVAGRLGGRIPALTCAVMAAFSFDFFHVRPVRVLHGRTLLLAVAAYGVLGLVTAARQQTGLGRS